MHSSAPVPLLAAVSAFALACAVSSRASDAPPSDALGLDAGQGARLVAVPELALAGASERSPFRDPGAVSIDPFGAVFVADTGNHRVVHFDRAGRFVFEFGGHGWNVGELSSPSDVCAREGFRLFVVDEGNERIQEYDISDASAEGAVLPFREGSGFASEALVRPSRMDLDREGRIYVTDALGHVVWVFSATGELVVRLGGLGEAPGFFRQPQGVAVGPAGRVFVADAGNGRVQVFDAIGNWLAAWSGPPADPFVAPTGIDVDDEGRVWIADAGAGRVRAVTTSGAALLEIGAAPPGSAGEGGRFREPVDVGVGPDGRIWVVDRRRGTVERFRIERVPGD